MRGAAAAVVENFGMPCIIEKYAVRDNTDIKKGSPL